MKIFPSVSQAVSSMSIFSPILQKRTDLELNKYVLSLSACK